ncbi:MAG: hypothetical protein ACTHN5_09995 [Phycisphaerae bacterium]
MTAATPILPYATPAHLPTSGHARISFWSGIFSFPLLFLLIYFNAFTRIDRLPLNKTDVLLFRCEIFLLYVSPLCAIIYGTSALIRIGFSRAIIEGKAIAWAGIALGAAYFLVTWRP